MEVELLKASDNEGLAYLEKILGLTRRGRGSLLCGGWGRTPGGGSLWRSVTRGLSLEVGWDSLR